MPNLLAPCCPDLPEIDMTGAMPGYCVIVAPDSVSLITAPCAAGGGCGCALTVADLLTLSGTGDVGDPWIVGEVPGTAPNDFKYWNGSSWVIGQGCVTLTEGDGPASVQSTDTLCIGQALHAWSAGSISIDLPGGQQLHLEVEPSTDPGNALTLGTDGKLYVATGGGGNITIKQSGAVIGSRPAVDFIPGPGVTLNVVDDPGGNDVNVEISAPGSLPEIDNTVNLASVGTMAGGGFKWGVDPSTGNGFYVDNVGNWQQFNPGGGGGGGGALVYVAEVVVTSEPTVNIEFTEGQWGLDAESLVVIVSGRVNTASGSWGPSIYLGTGGTIDSGANYTYEAVGVGGTVSTSDEGSGDNRIQTNVDDFTASGAIAAAGAEGLTQGHMTIEIPDMQGTTFWKTVNWWGGVGSGNAATPSYTNAQGTGVWRNTAKPDILRIAADIFGATTWLTGTRIQLYKRTKNTGGSSPCTCSTASISNPGPVVVEYNAAQKLNILDGNSGMDLHPDDERIGFNVFDHAFGGNIRSLHPTESNGHVGSFIQLVDGGSRSKGDILLRVRLPDIAQFNDTQGDDYEACFMFKKGAQVWLALWENGGNRVLQFPLPSPVVFDQAETSVLISAGTVEEIDFTNGPASGSSESFTYCPSTDTMYCCDERGLGSTLNDNGKTLFRYVGWSTLSGDQTVALEELGEVVCRPGPGDPNRDVDIPNAVGDMDVSDDENVLVCFGVDNNTGHPGAPALGKNRAIMFFFKSCDEDWADVLTGTPRFPDYTIWGHDTMEHGTWDDVNSRVICGGEGGGTSGAAQTVSVAFTYDDGLC